jgi:hypothetical protein
VIFIVSKRARRHIEAAQAWWIENRPAARTALLDELSSVITLDELADLLRLDDRAVRHDHR